MSAITEFAGQLFFRLWRASHTRTAAALESLGLTTALFAVLNVLGARESAMQRELSAAMGIDPSTIVALVDDLEAKGLATRERHPKDRRAWAVAITPAGRKTLERARRAAQRVEDEVLGGLSEAERRRLLTLLHRALDAAPAQPPWHEAEVAST